MIFLAIRDGVYRYDVLGAFATEAEAAACGVRAVEAEHDHYHDAVIVGVEVGQEGETEIGHVKRHYVNMKYVGAAYEKATR